MYLIALFAGSIIAILLSALIRENRRFLEIIGVTSVIVEFIASLFIIASVLADKTYSLAQYFSLQAFEALILGTTTTVGLLAMAHSVGYLRGEQKKGMIGFTRVREFYILMNLFLLSMFVAITTTSPIIMWIAIESTTLSTVFLISFFNRKADIEAAWKYLIINSVGLLLGLLGTILFLTQASAPSGFIRWADLLSATSKMDPALIKFAFVFVLIGYGTKMGLVPMHTWKPDAYNKAPLPIVSLLSGALLNVAFLALLRFKIITDTAMGGSFSQVLFIFFGIISVVIASLIIYSQTNYKRFFAYSSIEHAGIMMLGFGFGGIGIFGAILHMVYHALGKSLLFLVSSNIALKYSSSRIKDITGLIKTMPYTSIMFIIGTVIIVGIPPSGIFFSEFYILLAGLKTNSFVAVTAAISLIIVFIAFFKQGFTMIFSQADPSIKIEKIDRWTLIPIAVMAVILIFLGLYLPQPINTLVKLSAELFTNKI